jgi:hypothetical protein
MYILILVKRYSDHEFAMVVSMSIDGVLLRMVVLTETCKNEELKNTVFISLTGRWLKSYI